MNYQQKAAHLTRVLLGLSPVQQPEGKFVDSIATALEAAITNKRGAYGEDADSVLVGHYLDEMDRLCAAFRAAEKMREWIQPLAPYVVARGTGTIGCGWMDEWELIEVHKTIQGWDRVTGGDNDTR